MKRSTSKLQIRKGSMTHLGTTPCKFKIDVFISYVDNIKNADEVCVTWERRGKVEATSIVKVKDDKAVLRETMSMESTLFKRPAKGKDKKAETEQIKFDEKKVKFILRKGGPDGKAIGKISMNIAEYVRGITSTVFADLKLSNGSVIVSKIEATMLHMGKKSKAGSTAGSEVYSEMSEPNSLETDSLFGDDDDVTGDLEAPASKTPPSKAEAEVPSSKTVMSPVSSTSCSSAGNPQLSKEGAMSSSPKPEASQDESTEHESQGIPKRRASVVGILSSKREEEELKQSPSLRQKLKNKIKEKTISKREKDEDAESGEASLVPRKSRFLKAGANEAEVKELRRLVESLKEENAKLRRGKQAAMDEIDALRSDLEACENALEEATQGDQVSNRGSNSESDICSLKEKDKKIAELRAQNQGLIDELEERHEEEVQGTSRNDDRKGMRETIKSLQKRIEDLEVALRREPQFLDVVNELKVTKVSLALANMEKEQMIFALQSIKQDLGVEDSD